MTVNPAHEHHTAPGLATVHATTTADALALSSPSLRGSGVTQRRPCRCTSAHAVMQHACIVDAPPAPVPAPAQPVCCSHTALTLYCCSAAPLHRCSAALAAAPLLGRLSHPRSAALRRRPLAATTVDVGSGYLDSLSTPRCQGGAVRPSWPPKAASARLRHPVAGLGATHTSTSASECHTP